MGTVRSSCDDRQVETIQICGCTISVAVQKCVLVSALKSTVREVLYGLPMQLVSRFHPVCRRLQISTHEPIFICATSIPRMKPSRLSRTKIIRFPRIGRETDSCYIARSQIGRAHV